MVAFLVVAFVLGIIAIVASVVFFLLKIYPVAARMVDRMQPQIDSQEAMAQPVERFNTDEALEKVVEQIIQAFFEQGHAEIPVSEIISKVPEVELASFLRKLQLRLGSQTQLLLDSQILSAALLDKEANVFVRPSQSRPH
jgi:hypothetical protein